MIDYSKVKPIEMLSDNELEELSTSEIPAMIYKVETDADGKRGTVKLRTGRIPKGWGKFTPEVCEMLVNEAGGLDNVIEHEVQ